MKRSVFAVVAVLAGLAVGAAAYGTPDAAPGQAVGADEAAGLVGGACVGTYSRDCGGGACGTDTGYCLMPGGTRGSPEGCSRCNSNCSIWERVGPCYSGAITPVN